MSKHNPQGRYDAAEAEYIRVAGAGRFPESDRFDEATSIFLARELQYVRRRVLEAPKAPLEAFQVFPVQTEVPAGAESAYQRIYDAFGMAKIISNYADDLPRADVAAKEIPVKLRDVGAAYGYNVSEIRSAQYAGVNLPSMKAKAARRSIDERLNAIAWKGDDKFGIIGFLNNPNITETNIPADGDGGKTAFSTKTAEQVVRDVNKIIQSIPNATNQIETANTVLLAPDAYNHLATTARSEHSDTTILEFLRRTHPEITRWMKVGALKGAGTDGSDLIIAGRFEPDYVKFEIPMRYNQLPVEIRNLEYVVNCMARVIGVTVTFPLAFVKAQGV